MENDIKCGQPAEEYPDRQPLQILQNNEANFIACDLRHRELEDCQGCLKSLCQKPIKVYANSRNYLACEVRQSQTESFKGSQSEKLSRTLPKIRCSQKMKDTKNLWHWCDDKDCPAKGKTPPSKSLSFAQKGSCETDLLGSVSETFKYRPKSIKRAVLRETNKYRKLHGASPLKMNDNLSSFAQEWAEHLAFYNLLETRPFAFYGENIISARKPEFSVKRMMKLWYQEKYNYDYLDPHFDLYTGHFTQMVWRNTEYLGVGVASNDSCIWIVCNYDPPGNMRDHFQENVLPRKLLYNKSREEEEEQSLKSRSAAKRRP